MKKCEKHPHYYGNKPPKENCKDCNYMWELYPYRKTNIKKCLCLQCKKRITKPHKKLFNYCYEIKESCSFKQCQDCLEIGEQIIECEFFDKK